MIDGMRRYLKKEICIEGCRAIIIDCWTCYEGDFFEIQFISGNKIGTQKRYSAWDSDFCKCLPDLNKSS